MSEAMSADERCQAMETAYAQLERNYISVKHTLSQLVHGSLEEFRRRREPLQLWLGELGSCDTAPFSMEDGESEQERLMKAESDLSKARVALSRKSAETTALRRALARQVAAVDGAGSLDAGVGALQVELAQENAALKELAGALSYQKRVLQQEFASVVSGTGSAFKRRKGALVEWLAQVQDVDARMTLKPPA